jgi:transposase
VSDASPRFEPINRQQIVLEPLDVEQLIPENHAARSIWSILARLDLSRFQGQIKAVEGHAGRNVWEPRLLIAVWIYAYSRGISSAREIERQLAYEPALRWLAGLQVVNHHTLSDFRVAHGAALQDLFVQVLGILTMEKLVTLERVTVDGTKIRAAVNKKTFSRAQKIREHLKVAREHIEELQKQAAEQEKRTRRAAAERRAARERVERLEEALVEVERLQAEKQYERDKPCQASVTDAGLQRAVDHGREAQVNRGRRSEQVPGGRGGTDSGAGAGEGTDGVVSGASGGRRWIHDARGGGGGERTGRRLLRELEGVERATAGARSKCGISSERVSI